MVSEVATKAYFKTLHAYAMDKQYAVHKRTDDTWNSVYMGLLAVFYLVWCLTLMGRFAAEWYQYDVQAIYYGHHNTMIIGAVQAGVSGFLICFILALYGPFRGCTWPVTLPDFHAGHGKEVAPPVLLMVPYASLILLRMYWIAHYGDVGAKNSLVPFVIDLCGCVM
jgi:hypothetical protein